jgi:hypothetical protein
MRAAQIYVWCGTRILACGVSPPSCLLPHQKIYQVWYRADDRLRSLVHQVKLAAAESSHDFKKRFVLYNTILPTTIKIVWT